MATGMGTTNTFIDMKIRFWEQERQIRKEKRRKGTLACAGTAAAEEADFIFVTP